MNDKEFGLSVGPIGEGDIMSLIVGTRSKAVSELAEVLGFNPKLVHSLSLTMGVDDVALVHAKVYVEEKQLKEFTTVLKRYKLVKMEGEE